MQAHGCKHVFKAFHVCLGLHIVVMITGIYISQEMFAIDVLTALKSSLEQRRKRVLRLVRPYGNQAQRITLSVFLYLQEIDFPVPGPIGPIKGVLSNFNSYSQGQ